MNPDKLFDYLEGRLPAAERAALEERLMSDKQLQRELAVARQIHSGMRGDSREVLLPAPSDPTEQGRKMALRVGAAFIVLMAVNVGIGLWLIARHETQNPNRALLEKQMRDQIANSLEHAAAAFTPAPLGVSEIMIPAAPGKLDAVADETVTIATRFGGSATKGLADQRRRGHRPRLQQGKNLDLRCQPKERKRVSLCKSSRQAQAAQSDRSHVCVNSGKHRVLAPSDRQDSHQAQCRRDNSWRDRSSTD